MYLRGKKKVALEEKETEEVEEIVKEYMDEQTVNNIVSEVKKHQK